MREVLFRGYSPFYKRWVVGDLLVGGIDYETAIREKQGEMWVICRVDPATIGQFTGVLNKRGTWIFEGDIVRQGKFTISVVEFCTEEVASCGCCYPGFVGSGFKATGVDLSKCEVIGNIHDNPELMEGKSDA